MAEHLVGQGAHLQGLVSGPPQVLRPLPLVPELAVLEDVQIAHQLGQGGAQIVGEGGDQRAVGADGLVFPRHLLQHRQAHLLDAAAQLGQLVPPPGHHLVGQIAAGQHLHVPGQPGDAPDEQGGVGHQDHKEAQGRAQQGEEAACPVVVEVVGHGVGVEQPVGTGDHPPAVALQRVGVQAGVRQALQVELHLGMLTRPVGVPQGLLHAQTVGAHIALEVLRRAAVAVVPVGLEAGGLEQPGQGRVVQQGAQGQGRRQGRGRHRQEFQPQAGGAVPLSQCDTPFPIRS